MNTKENTAGFGREGTTLCILKRCPLTVRYDSGGNRERVGR
jgi:hypothetical protein